MAATDPQQSIVPPSQTSGGTPPDAEEVARKGDWAGRAAEGIVPAAEGIVPAEQGGGDAPREMLGEDPELVTSVVGQTTGSDEPATETGVDLSAGDNADATSYGGPDDSAPPN